MCLRLYTIENKYVDFLRGDKKLAIVFENKDDNSHFARKYLGVVLTIGAYKYYVPLSSPKDSDYNLNGLNKIIRKSIIPIIRIVVKDKTGRLELKGTLKFSNMMPVPQNAITYYDITKETDPDYRILVKKEYEFIKKHRDRILKNALVLYNQKTKEATLFPAGSKKPGYLKNAVDFKYAEQVHDKYMGK